MTVTGGPAWVLGLLALGVVAEGPVATVLGGSLVGAGAATWWAVWTVAVAADTLSDLALVVLGRAGRRSRVPARLARGRRLGPTAQRRAAMTERVATSLPRVVLGAKLVDVAAVPAFLAVGYAGVPIGRVLAWAVPATAVRAGLLVALGAFLGHQLADALAARPWLLVLVGVAVAAVLLVARAVTVRVLTHRRNRCAC